MSSAIIRFFILLFYINFGSTSIHNGIGKKYTVVPSNLPISASHIHLSENKIQTIGEHDFTGFASLQSLRLDRNSIRNISQNSFQGSPVQKLYLSRNPLGVFPNLVNLKQYLTYLELVSCGIANLSADFVIDYDKLDTLYLTSNPIASLPNMTKFEAKLRYLGLSNCSLTDIPNGYFEGFGKLERLHLAKNKFVNLTAFTFKGLYSLKFLELASNKLLENTDPEAFSGLMQMVDFDMLNDELLKNAPILKNSTKLRRLRVSMTKFTTLPTDYITHMKGR